MDNAFSFSPLWEEEAIFSMPEAALDALHAHVLEVIFQNIPSSKLRQRLSKQEILRAVAFVIAEVVPNLADDNEVLTKIRSTAAKLAPEGNPGALIDASISLWFTQAVLVIWQHHQGRRLETEPDLALIPWAAGYSNEFPVANLGFMTMLRGKSEWAHPKDPKLQTAFLISQATISVLYAVYSIGPHLETYPWRHLYVHCAPTRARELFLKVSISISGSPYNERPSATPPAFEYGITLEDVRVSRCGKKLLVKVFEDDEWRTAPYWHPYLKRPGSPWNNYIRNELQPTFSTGLKGPSSQITYRLPSTALTVASLFRERYSMARQNIDAANPNFRPHLSETEILRQYKRLARLSGQKYAKEIPSETTADQLNDVVEHYLYHTPLVQKPRADSGGYLTLPFMSTAVHAFRFLENPTELGGDFFTMAFHQNLESSNSKLALFLTTNMPYTRDDLVRALASASQQDIMEIISAPNAADLLNEIFDRPAVDCIGVDNDPPQQSMKNAGTARAKRPLNAFMAFRTYYLKLFPDVQQKSASGFLTQLWGKDPHRNKWALVAKVYSFVRDHVGRARVSLSAFLGVACPTMKIIEPNDYLQILGWEIHHDNGGSCVLSQDLAILSTTVGMLQDSDHPATEIDLLSAILGAGYFSDVGPALMERMWANNNGIMTTTGAGAGDYVIDSETFEPLYDSVPATAEKTSFVNAVRDNPYQAAQDLFGPHYDAAFFKDRFVHSWEVENLTGFQDVQISIADHLHDPNTFYNFDRPHGSYSNVDEFDFDASINQGIIHLSSAWSVDHAVDAQLKREREASIRSQQTTEGEHDSAI
ncbi:hypothetical protein F66182_8729 [Fusarium sp. NRRL 66182]|nr:hypothetical protein F66182_8729 [Fusarium sp. NRRL 66182]